MSVMDMEAALRSLLGKLGLAGIRYGMADESERIFLGLRELDGTRIGPVIGLAQVYMARNAPSSAAALLEKFSGTDPEAALYYGIACSLMGNTSQAESVWRSLAEGEGDVSEAARGFLHPDKDENRAEVFWWLKRPSGGFDDVS